jgi:hypothetical protein
VLIGDLQQRRRAVSLVDRKRCGVDEKGREFTPAFCRCRSGPVATWVVAAWLGAAGGSSLPDFPFRLVEHHIFNPSKLFTSHIDDGREPAL